MSFQILFKIITNVILLSLLSLFLYNQTLYSEFFRIFSNNLFQSNSTLHLLYILCNRNQASLDQTSLQTCELSVDSLIAFVMKLLPVIGLSSGLSWLGVPPQPVFTQILKYIELVQTSGNTESSDVTRLSASRRALNLVRVQKIHVHLDHVLFHPNHSIVVPDQNSTKLID